MVTLNAVPAPRTVCRWVLFQAEDGIRDLTVTGVQTCALPISAASVLGAIDKSKYEVVPIGITKEGRWLTSAEAEKLLNGKTPEHEARHLRAGDPESTPAAAVLAAGEAVVVPPEPKKSGGSLAPFQTDPPLTRRASDRAINVDIIFPVLHGTFCQDGTT